MVGLVGAVGEDLEEAKVRGILWRLGEGLDLWCLQEFGEDVGVRVRGGLGDQIGGGAG